MYHDVTIIGNLGTDPTATFDNKVGVEFSVFTVAANSYHRTPDGGKVEDTIWFYVTMRGAAARACNNTLRAGSLVMVRGRLVADRNTGNPEVVTGKNGPAARFTVQGYLVRFLKV